VDDIPTKENKSFIATHIEEQKPEEEGVSHAEEGKNINTTTNPSA
jgi:hypothetical protein